MGSELPGYVDPPPEAPPMRTLAPGVHVVEAPQRFFGLEIGARMTVLETSGGLVVHSPVDMAPASVASLGAVRWVVAPNTFHHLYVGRWAAAGVEAWAAPGLAAKRPEVPFAGVLDTPGAPFGEEVAVFPLRCFPMSNEVVFLHRPSRTLVVTDLVFNLNAAAPWATRAAFACLGGYPGCRTTVLERVGFDRPTARREINMLLDQDFDRLILAHGDVVETGGREALRGAMAWLGV